MMLKLFAVLILHSAALDSVKVDSADKDSSIMSPLIFSETQLNHWYTTANVQMVKPVDTVLTNVEESDLLLRPVSELRNAGNMGLSHFAFEYQPTAAGNFSSGIGFYDVYKMHIDSQKIYNLKRPFVELGYSIGLKRESLFEGDHSQNIGSRFNYGVSFKRIASTGTYQRQQTAHSGFSLYGRFISRKGVYRNFNALNFCKIQAEENGGVLVDVFDEDTAFVTKELAAVRLNNAETNDRDLAYRFSQSVDVKALFSGGTTSKMAIFLGQQFDVSRRKFRFVDLSADSTFYQAFYDTGKSKVKHVYRQRDLGASVFVGNFDRVHYLIAELPKFQWQLTADFTNRAIEQNETDYAINHLDLKFFGLYQFNRKGSSLQIKLKQDVLGDSERARLAKLSFQHPIAKGWGLALHLHYNQSPVAFIDKNYRSTSISWTNDFEPLHELGSSVSVSSSAHGFKFVLSHQRLKNYTFWRELNRVEQFSGSTQIFKVHLRKNFRLGKFHLDNDLFFQYIDNGAQINRPLFWSVHSLYYQNLLFKGVLQAQIGFDVRYNSPFELTRYFPVTQQHIVQNTVKNEALPVIDLYVNLAVRTVRIYFKVNYLNQGIYDTGYYDLLDMPARDRSFTGGVRWRFLE